MNSEIKAMLLACEGRYPTKAEQALLRDWAGKLEGRLVALEEIRQREEAIVGQTIDEVLRAYPDFEKKYKDARQSCARDLTLVLRYCVQALLRGDPHYLEDSLLTWMATILRGVGFTGQFVEDTYRTLQKIAMRELSPGTGEMLRPFLEQCVAVLPGKGKNGGAS